MEESKKKANLIVDPLTLFWNFEYTTTTLLADYSDVEFINQYMKCVRILQRGCV